MKLSHAHQSPLPTGVLGSSNCIPEIGNSNRWGVSLGDRLLIVRAAGRQSILVFGLPFFFSGESDCVLDDGTTE